MRAVWILLLKELGEMRRSPILLLSMVSLPVTTVVVPLLLVWYLAAYAPEESIIAVKQLYELPGESAIEVLVAAAARNWLLIFLLMPVFLPVLIAAQSIGGERERRTLEPLLATPISTTSIVFAKSLAAVVPALGITWAAAAVFIGTLDLVSWRDTGTLPLPDAIWSFAIFVLSPLLALFGNAVAVAVSAVVTDPRAAQNLAAMTVVPLVGIMVAQVMGKLDVGMGFYVGFAAALVVLDALLVWAGAALFDRERLLR